MTDQEILEIAKSYFNAQHNDILGIMGNDSIIHFARAMDSVCEGIYRERVRDNLMLCESLRAIYAICGEDKQVEKIVHDAIRDYGVDDA